MKRFLMMVSLMMLGIFSTVTPADLAVMNPDDIEDITYAQKLRELKDETAARAAALKDAAAARATALKDAAAARASALKEAGKSAAGTAWRGFTDTGIPFATTTDVVAAIPGETVVSPYEMDESMGGYFAPRTYRKIPERRFGQRRNVTIGEAGEAAADLADRGYNRAMAGLDYGMEGLKGGARAIGRGAQAGYGAARRAPGRAWRGFVNTGVPGTSETEYKVVSEETPYSFGEWMGTSPVQRRKTVGEVGQAVGRGAQAAYGAARRAPGRAWRGFVDTGIPLTSVTETELSPYELDVFGDLTPQQQRKIQRRRTFGEVGSAIQGGAQDVYGAASRGVNYLGNRGAAGAGYIYRPVARGAGYLGNRAAAGANYVGRGIGNIPVLGTTATDVEYLPYQPTMDVYDTWIVPQQKQITQRRKTLGEKAGEWYGAIKNKFSSQKK